MPLTARKSLLTAKSQEGGVYLAPVSPESQPISCLHTYLMSQESYGHQVHLSTLQCFSPCFPPLLSPHSRLSMSVCLPQ